MSKSGLTLIELLISIAIATVITGTIVLMLNSGLTAWRFAQDRIVIQAVAEDIETKILEGDFKYDGLREALKVWSAGPSAITIVPLYVDDSYIVKRPQKEFFLKKQFQPGSPDPVVQIKRKREEKFKTVTAKFIYGKGDNPNNPDDKIIFGKSPELGSRLRIMFYPDARRDSSVKMTFRWDREAKIIYRTYKDKIENLLKYHPDVKVEEVKFTYLDNLNNEIKSDEEGPLSGSQLMRISGVNVYLKIRRKEDMREIVSFVNIRERGYQMTGVILSEGAEIDIANSFNIVTLALASVAGVDNGDIIVFEAVPEVGKVWELELEFMKVGEVIKVHRYTIEYPPGTIVAGDTVDQAVGEGREFSFLNLTEDGMFDYDKDPGVDDVVRLAGDRVKLKVTRMDPDGVYLSVWP